jgi:hypothetical protein
MSEESAGRRRRRANAQQRRLAAEREALWEARALSVAESVPEADFSPGVRAALEQIIAEEEQGSPAPLARVAERGVGYGTGDELAALAARHGVTLEALAARPDLPLEIVRALGQREADGSLSSDCPPALLAEVSRVLRAPIAEVAQTLQAERDSGETRSFAAIITMAPSLSEEQRRHWLALLAADPA